MAGSDRTDVEDAMDVEPSITAAFGRKPSSTPPCPGRPASTLGIPVTHTITISDRAARSVG